MPRKSAAVETETKPKTAAKRKVAASADEPKTRTRRSRTKNTDPNKPKKPMNSYMTWFIEFKNSKEWKKHDTGNAKENARLGGKLWNELPAAKKKPYQDNYQKALEKYKKEMENYEAPQ